MPAFHPSMQSPEDDEWQSTRAQGVGGRTHVLGHTDDEFEDDTPHDIGRPVGAGQWELFIVSAPAEAMQMQFEHMRPEYIAIHDVGTASSRRLVQGLAAAVNAAVQRLVIRRQGYGVSLATIEFVELPIPGKAPLRLYTTEVDADTHSRHELARVILGHSRLGVVMVGDLPPHALAGSLQPLRDGIAAGPWPNRNLLMLPLGSGSALAGQAGQLGMGRGVEVRTTPQVTRPAEAWGFISGSWNKLREDLLTSGGPTLPLIGGAPARRAGDAPATPPIAPLPMQPMPEVPKASAPAAPAASPLAEYVQQCAQIKGVVSCCAFELATHRPIAHAGSQPGAAALAAQGAALYMAMAETGKQLGLGMAQPDAAVSLASHHLLLRPMPGWPGVVLHAVLERSSTNLTLIRLKLQRMDEALAPGYKNP
jgi:hypothetical protein